MTGWKQPIPTDLYKEFGEDDLARDLYIHLLLRSCNTDMAFPNFYKKKSYQLKRGETIFGRHEYSRILRASPSGTHTALTRLEKRQLISQLPYNGLFTIVKVNNYDEVCRMNSQKDSQKTAERQLKDTSKSVKSDKSVKDIINTILKFEQKRDELIEAAKNKYPNKNAGKAFDDMLEYSKIHGKVYKDWSLAYLKWVREDTYKKYNLVTEYGEMIPWAD